ncbi:CAP domain-containing protein [Streptomyces collinus]|uniref:CAP domain-containing protein n=1 Tax=Streptomyces collinus TaxID=42684 RepID=UPI00294239C4|nr:CAP domain-containing protein [Streptomyces collinus]
MAKHRKKQHYRRMVIAAVVVGAVGVPTAAMACGEWPGGGETPGVGAGTPTTPEAGAYTGSLATIGQMFESPARTPTAAPSPARAQPDGVHHLVVHRKHHRAHHRKHVRPGGPTSAPSKALTASPTPQRTGAPAPKATAPQTAPKASAPTSAAPAASGVAARIVALVNAERAKVGCSALTLNPTLTKVAQAHSQDMATHQNMSHTGSDGSSPGDRITGAGYDWSSYGENVAYGYGTPEQVMAGWMSSPGHRANILNCSFKEIGVGLAQPNSYWTQDFGTAR